MAAGPSQASAKNPQRRRRGRRTRRVTRALEYRGDTLRCIVVLSTLLGACERAAGVPDEAAARQQIGVAAAAIWDAVDRGDAPAILAEYADDAIVMGAGGPMVQGKPAVAAWLQGLLAGNTFEDVKGTVADIMISGNLAVETGTYAMTIVPANGNRVSDKGKYIHVWRRSPDGAWKVVRYTATSDLPPR